MRDIIILIIFSIIFIYMCSMYVINSKVYSNILKLLNNLIDKIQNLKSFVNYNNILIVIGIIKIKYKTLFLIIGKYVFCAFKKVWNYIKLILSPRSKVELLYGMITIYLISAVPMIIYIEIVKFNLLSVIYFITWILVVVHISIKYILKKSIDSKSVLIFIANIIKGLCIVLFMMVLVLVIVEKMKNGKGGTKIGELVTVTLFILSIIELFLILKNILDKGIISVASTVGVVVYFLVLFFITSTIGFFITGRYPNYYFKDEILVYADSKNGLGTYLFSYSYRGAKCLMSFPENTDIKDKKGKSIDFVPIDLYVIYLLGIFFNIIITAFFVSYSVSIYILKVSDEQNYSDYIKKIQENGFANKYKNYLEGLNERQK